MTDVSKVTVTIDNFLGFDNVSCTNRWSPGYGTTNQWWNILGRGRAEEEQSIMKY